MKIQCCILGFFFSVKWLCLLFLVLFSRCARRTQCNPHKHNKEVGEGIPAVTRSGHKQKHSSQLKLTSFFLAFIKTLE